MASFLPAAHGFAGFCKYLTIFSFTAQTLSLLASAASLPFPSLRRFADDLASALFSFATMVTLAFYALQINGQAMDDEDIIRPVFISEITHL